MESRPEAEGVCIDGLDGGVGSVSSIMVPDDMVSMVSF